MTYAEWVEREMAAARRVRTEVNRAPRAECERAAADFFRAMKTSPRLVGDRVRWLLLESYGLGPARWANAVPEERGALIDAIDRAISAIIEA